MNPDELIVAVRSLHAMNEYGDCPGDDMDGYECETPEWPCRTAKLVYTEDEITATREGYEAGQRAIKAMITAHVGKRRDAEGGFFQMPPNIIEQFLA